jgi:hypothetical protein
MSVNRRGGRITESGSSPNRYGRSAHEKNLSDEQKDNRVLVSRALLDRVTSDTRRWNLGFRVRSHNQKTEFRVAHLPVTSTKDGPNVVHYFLSNPLTSRTMFRTPSLSPTDRFLSQSNLVVPRRCRQDFNCDASSPFSSRFISTQASLPNFTPALAVMLWTLNFCFFSHLLSKMSRYNAI